MTDDHSLNSVLDETGISNKNVNIRINLCSFQVGD